MDVIAHLKSSTLIGFLKENVESGSIDYTGGL